MKNVMNNNGLSCVSVCVYILAVTCIFAAVFGFSGAFVTLTTLKENAKRALGCVAVENAIEIYDSIKQGHNKTDEISGRAFEDRLLSVTGAVKDDEGAVLFNDDGSMVWRITRPEVGFETEGLLKLKAEFTVYVPFRVLDVASFDIPVRIRVTSRYVNYLIE